MKETVIRRFATIIGLPLWELPGKNLEPIWKGKIEVALDSLFTACADKV